MSASDKLEAAAKTFRDKAAEYGDDYTLVGNALKALFPAGLHLQTAEEFVRFHLFVMDMVKGSRYAVNFKNGGHQDSVRDKTVYAAMLETVDEIFAAIKPLPVVNVNHSKDYHAKQIILTMKEDSSVRFDDLDGNEVDMAGATITFDAPVLRTVDGRALRQFRAATKLGNILAKKRANKKKATKRK